ncbi:MAG: acyl carrier protein [Conexibacter sp.]
MSSSTEGLAYLDEILASIRQLNRDGVDIEPDTELLESGLLDSLGIVALIAQMERQFAVSLLDGDFTVENFASPRVISDLVRRYQA